MKYSTELYARFLRIEDSKFAEWFSEEKNEFMTVFEALVEELCDMSNPYSFRRDCYRACLNLREEFKEQIEAVYCFNDKAIAYKDKICHRDSSVKEFDDGINYDAPNVGGLYFIGETHFDPFNDEKFYCVKIGKADNLAKRMRQYNTHNPMLWRIDFAPNAEALEEYYHKLLAQVAEARCSHNKEWFFVDRITYFKMCRQGFKFFEK